jgi:AcrR family transcriptional regulator
MDLQSGNTYAKRDTGEAMAAVARTPRSSWIDAGLRVLGVGGPDAVRIEQLAEALGVTRGGFYWYFKDRKAFLEEMLDTWESRSIDQALERVESEGGDARDKVRRAGMLTFSRELLPIDLAVRDWARRDSSVAARLRRVDNRRMEYLRALISTFCADPVDVEARGMLAFSLGIANHFIAAEHETSNRAEVLEAAMKRVLS